MQRLSYKAAPKGKEGAKYRWTVKQSRMCYAMSHMSINMKTYMAARRLILRIK